VCHTVEGYDGGTFAVTSVAETLRKTTMGELDAGSRVNLEAAARADTALGGHIVQGHVDGVGTVVSFTDEGEDRLLTIAVPEGIHELLVARGSIAVDGVSLTVARLYEEPRVSIAIIPYTLEHTNIGSYREGTRVNLEADVIGKYVKQYVDRLVPAANRPTGD
jgi:riboflavin synthase